VNITETLDQLSALQTTDSRIQALEQELGELPRRLESAREDLEAVQQKLNAAQEELDTVLKKRRELEGEIATCDQNVIKYENEKLKVKTNEEYRAMNNQIAHEKEKKSALEDQVLMTYEDEEGAAEKTKRLKSEVDSQSEQFTRREEEIRARSAADEQELQSLRESREKIAPGLEQAMLRRYEKIRKMKGGVAVVPVTAGACGGCQGMLPPQQVAEVRKRDHIETCEGCGRYLVWPGVGTPAS
jgi:predicted  nucleic acid-binding Zn-ribbon protein